MKLIKQLETHRNHTVAQSVTYKNVTFIEGFATFLEALLINKLILTKASRVLVERGFRWTDDLGAGGIVVETTLHPLIRRNFAGDVTVVGNKDHLTIFQTLLETHNVEYEGATKPENIELKHQYHETLNPKLWNDNKTIKENVKAKLLQAANVFIEFLKITDLDVKDIILTGSAANYNWTIASDLDVHVIVDFDEVETKHGDLVEEYFQAKKNVFNNLHRIALFGQTVELYVQDANERHQSTGMFSLQNNKWREEPQHKEPSIDDTAVRTKTAELMNAIDAVTENCSRAAPVEELMEKLKKMRGAGLVEAGEFSVENLVFKQLRRNGYLEKLAMCKTKAFDRELSIEDEAWSQMC